MKKNPHSKPLSKNAKLTLVGCITFITCVFIFSIIKKETTINTDARLLSKETPYQQYGLRKES